IFGVIVFLLEITWAITLFLQVCIRCASGEFHHTPDDYVSTGVHQVSCIIHLMIVFLQVCIRCASSELHSTPDDYVSTDVHQVWIRCVSGELNPTPDDCVSKVCIRCGSESKCSFEVH
ncbi:unnamed protein product, partial [Timema podura]|nr:unnamed protein product [Timema podura]